LKKEKLKPNQRVWRPSVNEAITRGYDMCDRTSASLTSPRKNGSLS